MFLIAIAGSHTMNSTENSGHRMPRRDGDRAPNDRVKNKNLLLQYQKEENQIFKKALLHSPESEINVYLPLLQEGMSIEVQIKSVAVGKNGQTFSQGNT
jgi:hypothetical protein